MLLNKEVLGSLSAFVSIGITLPYCWMALRGRIKPHAFTWIVWAPVMGINAAARTTAHAGPGAWASWTGFGAVIAVAIIASFKGERQITRGDIIALVAALSAIPLWMLTEDPLLAVILVTFIDAVAYYPTIRKSWLRPREEAVFNFAASNAVHVLSVLATVSYSWTTLLYPLVVFTCNTVLIGIILWRRRVLHGSGQATGAV